MSHNFLRPSFQETEGKKFVSIQKRKTGDDRLFFLACFRVTEFVPDGAPPKKNNKVDNERC